MAFNIFRQLLHTRLNFNIYVSLLFSSLLFLYEYKGLITEDGDISFMSIYVIFNSLPEYSSSKVTRCTGKDTLICKGTLMPKLYRVWKDSDGWVGNWMIVNGMHHIYKVVGLVHIKASYYFFLSWSLGSHHDKYHV